MNENDQTPKIDLDAPPSIEEKSVILAKLAGTPEGQQAIHNIADAIQATNNAVSAGDRMNIRTATLTTFIPKEHVQDFLKSSTSPMVTTEWLREFSVKVNGDYPMVREVVRFLKIPKSTKDSGVAPALFYVGQRVPLRTPEGYVRVMLNVPFDRLVFLDELAVRMMLIGMPLLHSRREVAKFLEDHGIPDTGGVVLQQLATYCQAGVVHEFSPYRGHRKPWWASMPIIGKRYSPPDVPEIEIDHAQWIEACYHIRKTWDNVTNMQHLYHAYYTKTHEMALLNFPVRECQLVSVGA